MIATTELDIREKIANQMGRLVGFNINQVAHLMARHINREFVKSGFTLQMEQMPVLFAVYFATGGLLSQQEIANLLQKDKSGIQRTIRTLERDGYLRVQQDDIDRRKNLVQLTPAGKMIMEQVLSTAKSFDEQLTNKLSADEVDTLLGLLKKVSTSLES